VLGSLGTLLSVAIFKSFASAGMATTPDFSVPAKHVLITGGTGGIGNAFAEAFLNAAAHVIVADGKAPQEGIDPRRYEQSDEKFTEWMRDDRLRQPIFLGIGQDKNPEEVVRAKAS
jgi:NAD(P)-dependent dehydrogenase (short-subunit alcohol dehydrogenase family)